MGFDKEKFKEAGRKFLGITGHEAPEDPAPQGEKTEEEIKKIDEGFKTLEELEAEKEEALEKELEEDLAEGVEEVQAEENQDSTSEKRRRSKRSSGRSS